MMDPRPPERRLLLVDDDEASRILVRRAVREFDGTLAIDEADSGEAGIARMRAHPYGLVISDHHMSYLNGIDLLEATMRDAPAARRVLITSRADLALLQESLDRARIHGFVKKSMFPEDTHHDLLKILHDTWPRL